jgi:hypothetical protein
MIRGLLVGLAVASSPSLSLAAVNGGLGDGGLADGIPLPLQSQRRRGGRLVTTLHTPSCYCRRHRRSQRKRAAAPVSSNGCLERRPGHCGGRRQG